MDKMYTGSMTASMAGRVLDETQVSPKLNPIGGLYEAMNVLRDAASISRTTADQLCGSRPEATANETACKSAASYFGQIEDVGDELRALSQRISADMQRILSRL